MYIIQKLNLIVKYLYGPKGVGALYVRRRPRVKLEPIISGGGQERGLRSGTVPAPLAVGIGAACALAQKVGIITFSSSLLLCFIILFLFILIVCF